MEPNVPYVQVKNRWLVLAVVVTLTFMSCLDASIVTVALPTMATKLGVGTATINWVVNVYLIAITALILFFGKIADKTGKSRVFVYGIALFTVGSLICGLAGSLPVLLAARAVQAVGAGAAMATNQGIIAEVFPPDQRGQALGISGMSVALGSMAGPALGGLIVSFASWHYIFLINLPIGLAVFLIGQRILPKDSRKLEDKKQLDGPGSAVFAASMVLLFGGLFQGENLGYTQPLVLGMIGIAIVLFILFLLREKRIAHPMLDLRIFQNKLFTVSVTCAFINFTALNCTGVVLLPVYLQKLLDLAPSVAGLILVASPLVLVLVAPISGHLSDKIGSEGLTFVGLSIIFVSLILYAFFLTATTPILWIVLLIGFFSLGNGMFQSPNTRLIMSTVPRDMLGIAGSVNALIRNTGMVVGTTIASLLLYSRMSATVGHKVLDYVEDRPDAFSTAFRFVCLIQAGICLVGMALTAMRMVRRNASQTADALNESE